MIDDRMFRLLAGVSDASQNMRQEHLSEGIEDLSNNWLLGSFMGDVQDNFGKSGKYIHNYLSFWRQFGLVPFIGFFIILVIKVSSISIIWLRDKKNLHSWKLGKTGIPIVDAGMKELYEMGWMHNRVRMIVGSFLTKNLLIHWKEGERWFFDTLVDADIGSNSAGWQWIAGSGADASPYFRIFNPTLQGKKFDPKGQYVKKFLPSLDKIPEKFIHSPWEMTVEEQERYNFILGRDYPKPIIDLNETRKRALAAFKKISE